MEIRTLYRLFTAQFGTECQTSVQLVPAGSARKYYRLSDGQNTAVGAFNEDVRENRAFIGFTKHFRLKGLQVPEILQVDSDEKHYLLEDLGDITLKERIDSCRRGWEFPGELIPLYKKVIDELVKFQVKAHGGTDYSLCIPRDQFDSRSILWDLNHFKYFFLKMSGIPFREDQLEDDFRLLAGILDEVPRESFLFRDFQSRNIMVRDEKLYFIDYQGGRKGALQYDIASLLFESRVNIGPVEREMLLNYYLERISLLISNFNKEKFLQTYLLFALVRQLQAMGAYGLRGWIEKKSLFLQSVPFAMKNLKYFLENDKDNLNRLPELKRLMTLMSENEKLNRPLPVSGDKLTVRIFSFSYRKGIPDDLTGEGGGFVFDCRCINNPGRYPEYFSLTGLDEEVGKFFDERSEMADFLKDAFAVIDRSIDSYTGRGFKNLQVSFGCIGGQHRSVYAAQKLASHLEHNRLINVLIEHREIQDILR